jgi:PAS domain S-box-containing protein
MELNTLFSHYPNMLEDFIHLMGGMISALDASGKVVFWSPLATEVSGYTEKEAKKTGFLSSKGEIKDEYLQLFKKDGTLIKVKAYPLKTDNSLLWIILFKKSEVVKKEWCSDLFKQTMLYTGILQSMKEGVITIDSQFRITSFSKKSELITGYKSGHVLNQHCYDIIGSSLCKTNCPAKKCMETENQTDPHIADITCNTGKGCHISETAVPLKNDSQEIMGTLLFIEDRTAQVLLEGNPHDFMGIIGRSYPMRRIFQILKQVGPTDVTVLITGESGTGKEMIARAIHTLSRRKHKSFHAINCAALPLPLLESELFGHIKGAFTGATRDRAGNIETAQGGTLFLDEIGELPIETQSKLLRFLQEFEYQRVGSSKIRKADVRIIAATNRHLKQEIAAGNFREDLYYRIRVIPVEVPPLRERSEDIMLLAVSLLSSMAEKRGRPDLKFSSDAMELFLAYQWPGNVRELMNTLEYAIAMAPESTIQRGDLPKELRETVDGYPAISFKPNIPMNNSGESEREVISHILRETGGNKAKAARLLNIHRVTLYRKMKRYGLN